MSTTSKTSFISFDEFCLLVKGGQKADLIDGVIYMASPDNTDANKSLSQKGSGPLCVLCRVGTCDVN